QGRERRQRAACRAGERRARERGGRREAERARRHACHEATVTADTVAEHGGEPPPPGLPPASVHPKPAQRRSSLWLPAGPSCVTHWTRRRESCAAVSRSDDSTNPDSAPRPPTDPATLPNYPAYVPPKRSKEPWKSSRRTGESHYRLWATWGFYTKSVNPRMVV